MGCANDQLSVFLGDKNLENVTSMGVRTLRNLTAGSPELTFILFAHFTCYSSAKAGGAAFTGLEIKKAKNIQPDCVWGTKIMPPLKNLKCSLRAEEHLLGFFLL